MVRTRTTQYGTKPKGGTEDTKIGACQFCRAQLQKSMDAVTRVDHEVGTCLPPRYPPEAIKAALTLLLMQHQDR